MQVHLSKVVMICEGCSEGVNRVLGRVEGESQIGFLASCQRESHAPIEQKAPNKKLLTRQ